MVPSHPCLGLSFVHCSSLALFFQSARCSRVLFGPSLRWRLRGSDGGWATHRVSFLMKIECAGSSYMRVKSIAKLKAATYVQIIHQLPASTSLQVSVIFMFRRERDEHLSSIKLNVHHACDQW
jgi:hypothetical protein